MADTDNKLDPFTTIDNVQWNTRGPHHWNATAEASCLLSFSFNLPAGFAIPISLISNVLSGTATFTAAGLSDPRGITGGSYAGSGTNQSGIVQFIFGEFLTDQINPDARLGFNLQVDMSSILGGTGSASFILSGTSLGVTSGRPGGDDEQTASASCPRLLFPPAAFSVATLIGTAGASLHSVTASINGSSV